MQRTAVRTSVWFVCIGALIGLAVLGSGPRRLMSMATRVCPQISDCHYCWLSDHELLLIQGGVTGPDEVNWHLTRRDVRSGVETRLAGLETRFPHDIDAPVQAVASPDGRWLLWRSGGRIMAASLDGKNALSWQDDSSLHDVNDVLYWQSDSRHFVEPVSLPPHAPGDAEPLKVGVLIRDLAAPDALQRLPVSGRADLVASDYYAPPISTQQGALLTWCPVQEPTAAKTLVLDTYGTNGTERRFRIAALPATVFDCRHSQYGRSIAVSPGGDHITWLCVSRARSQPLLEWIEQRFVGRSHPRQASWGSLCISAIDGTGMREIGGFDLPGGDEYGGQWPGEIRWLPGGKLLSFEYEGALYTVAAD